MSFVERVPSVQPRRLGGGDRETAGFLRKVGTRRANHREPRHNLRQILTAILLVFLPGCSFFAGPAKPLPAPHTCYRTTGALISPTTRGGATWLMLTDSGGAGVGARWYSGRVVSENGRRQLVQWQTYGPASIRVRWNEGTGELQATEQRGILSGTAGSGTQGWRVSALREDCPRDA